jgi:hypothetical protein
MVKPSGLSELRAKAASPECTDKYFAELDSILTKYDLKEKPHLVYNVDEVKSFPLSRYPRFTA